MSRMEDFGFFLTKTFASTRSSKRNWPHIPGKYFVLDRAAPVAVTTLGSVDFARELSAAQPEHTAIIGKVETENIGVEKIIRNIIANPAIRFLLLVGKEPPKHLTGANFKALFANGVDERLRVIGSPSMRPILPNLAAAEINQFLRQVELVDMIGCMDISTIKTNISSLAARSPGVFTEKFTPSPAAATVPTVTAIYHDPYAIKLDKAGYFVVGLVDGEIQVEHYSYKEELLRVIKGNNARDIYLTIVSEGWVSALDHACYLGKELAKAELSLVHEFEYFQDGA